MHVGLDVRRDLQLARRPRPGTWPRSRRTRADGHDLAGDRRHRVVVARAPRTRSRGRRSAPARRPPCGRSGTPPHARIELPAACTLVIPTDEPSVAGFAKTGKPKPATRAATPSGSSRHSGSRTTSCGTTGSPAAAKSTFCTALSIPTADPGPPLPRRARPPARASPAPRRPRRAGRAGPGRPRRSAGAMPSAATNSRDPDSLASSTASPPPAATTGITPDSAGSAGGPEQPDPRPSRVMPIGTTSFVAGSRASITDRAERHEISCSAERPPNRTATRRLRSLTPSPAPGRSPRAGRPGPRARRSPAPGCRRSPPRRLASGSICRCVVEAAWPTSVCAPPRLVATHASSSASQKPLPPSTPPATSTASMPPQPVRQDPRGDR